VFDQLTVAALNLFAQNPPTVKSGPPPGNEKIMTILGWASWIAVGVCVLGVIIAGASMAVQHRNGGGGESASRLGWVAAGCVIVGSASAIVGGIV
jgi:TrbC/VIRB2 pilin